MVVRTRIRAVLIPLVSYCIAAAIVGYFVDEARHGARGLETRAEYGTQIAQLTTDYEALRSERQLWEHRVALMQSNSVDRDLLDEEAHTLLDRFDHRDLIVFLPQPGASKPAAP